MKRMINKWLNDSIKNLRDLIQSDSIQNKLLVMAVGFIHFCLCPLSIIVGGICFGLIGPLMLFEAFLKGIAIGAGMSKRFLPSFDVLEFGKNRENRIEKIRKIAVALFFLKELRSKTLNFGAEKMLFGALECPLVVLFSILYSVYFLSKFTFWGFMVSLLAGPVGVLEVYDQVCSRMNGASQGEGNELDFDVRRGSLEDLSSSVGRNPCNSLPLFPSQGVDSAPPSGLFFTEQNVENPTDNGKGRVSNQDSTENSDPVRFTFTCIPSEGCESDTHEVLRKRLKGLP